MLMRGDMNKMIQEVNKVMDGAFTRIQDLEDRLMRVEGVVEEPIKRPRGRPVGSKNKPKEEKAA